MLDGQRSARVISGGLTGAYRKPRAGRCRNGRPTKRQRGAWSSSRAWHGRRRIAEAGDGIARKAGSVPEIGAAALHPARLSVVWSSQRRDGARPTHTPGCTGPARSRVEIRPQLWVFAHGPGSRRLGPSARPTIGPHCGVLVRACGTGGSRSGYLCVARVGAASQGSASKRLAARSPPGEWDSVEQRAYGTRSGRLDGGPGTPWCSPDPGGPSRGGWALSSLPAT
jgi:hypothetical protein